MRLPSALKKSLYVYTFINSLFNSCFISAVEPVDSGNALNPKVRGPQVGGICARVNGGITLGPLGEPGQASPVSTFEGWRPQRPGASIIPEYKLERLGSRLGW